jgi:hypothetical protein
VLVRWRCLNRQDAVRWASAAQRDSVGGEASSSRPSLPVASRSGSRSVENSEQVRVHEGMRGGPRGKLPGRKDSMHTIWPRPHCGQSGSVAISRCGENPSPDFRSLSPRPLRLRIHRLAFARFARLLNHYDAFLAVFSRRSARSRSINLRWSSASTRSQSDPVCFPGFPAQPALLAWNKAANSRRA